MKKALVSDLRTALIALVFFTILCGLAYPLVITGVAQGIFPRQANGSVIRVDGQPVGSSLVGQDFSDPKYFHPRPSATVDSDGNPLPYNAASSSGSNLGPTSKALVDRITQDVSTIRQANGLASDAPVPADAVTASASGLDPHISPAYADLQVPRVAQARGLSQDQVRSLVKKYTDPPTLWLLGESRVNVLLLNLALDRTSGTRAGE